LSHNGRHIGRSLRHPLASPDAFLYDS